jgi:hypothetical protein
VQLGSRLAVDADAVRRAVTGDTDQDDAAVAVGERRDRLGDRLRHPLLELDVLRLACVQQPEVGAADRTGWQVDAKGMQRRI